MEKITRYYGSTGKPMCLLEDHEAALAAERKTINDALAASNEAGFASMSPAEVIRHQAQENAELKQQLDTLKLALQVECEKNEKLNACIDQDSETIRDQEARIAEFERWSSALMPHLEHLLDRSPSEFGIDGDGEDCWSLLAEFVMTGCVLLEEGK